APPPEPIKSIVYEGNGAGGVLRCNGLALSLNNSALKQPNVGTTKENELALSFEGKVFPFGPVKSGDVMACDVPATDVAIVLTRHGVLSWPTAFDFNFMTGNSASWKRHTYQQLTW